jgi:aryl-alcohol dehydrogenase-like predicted oxidoreductase
MKQEGMESLQIIFNIFRQKPISTIFEYLVTSKRTDVAIIVRLPLASGLLSGKFNKETTFAPQDHRTYNRDGQAFNVGETFAGLPFELGVSLADELKEIIGSDAESTMTQKSLRWILDYPAVTTVIPGAKNAEMARANAKASDLAPLTDELHEQLSHFYDSKVKENIRGPY